MSGRRPAAAAPEKQPAPACGAADPALSEIHGRHRARRLVDQVRAGDSAPDALLGALRDVLAQGDEDMARGFASSLQLALEGKA